MLLVISRFFDDSQTENAYENMFSALNEFARKNNITDLETKNRTVLCILFKRTCRALSRKYILVTSMRLRVFKWQ